MTLALLWEEYQAEFADRQTYRYTQSCEHYKAFTKRLKRSMRQIHRAGEKLFVDFAGPTLPLTTGRRAHIFVAAMGASNANCSFMWIGRDEGRAAPGRKRGAYSTRFT